MLYNETVVSGFNLRSEVTFNPKGKPILFSLNGTDLTGNSTQSIPITEEVLSKHLLLLGGIGSGKTNTFNSLLREIRRILTKDDVVIVFDTKGDFYREFYQPGDIVISNDERAVGADGKPDYWNIFREIQVDDRTEENVVEIAKTLFSERLERSSQPFFPNAAKDLLEALMLDLVRSEKRSHLRNNRSLRNLLDSFSVPAMKNILNQHQDMKAMVSYIQDPNSGQTMGVVSELQQLSREIFIGNFARRGNLSIRELVRNKGGRVVFVEYDLGIGETLSPVYRLIIDMAIKQALCRKPEEKGSVYFLIDEFRLLPKLQHIDDGVNFGRSLGAKFIVGIQNTAQVAAAYGEKEGTSMLSGFSSTLCFHVNDPESRAYTQGLYGENVKQQQAYTSTMRSADMKGDVRVGHVVEDKDICGLKVGQAIVSILNREPFTFQFEEYRSSWV